MIRSKAMQAGKVPPMSLTAAQLQVVIEINRRNAEFWADPQNNMAQHHLAFVQTESAKIATELRALKIRIAHRAAPAAKLKRAMGKTTREQVRLAAIEELRKDPGITRDQCAHNIQDRVGRKFDTVVTHLKK